MSLDSSAAPSTHFATSLIATIQLAVQNYEKTYETARSIVQSGQGSRSLLDKSRVSLGTARGNARFDRFLSVLNGDVNALLQWKNRRINFN